MNNIKEEILKNDIISFDIFDTALLRPYIEPWHLFLHIERYLKINGFCSARKLAEKIARKESHKEETTIDDIYKHISSEFKDLKQTEIDFEEKILKQNKKAYEIYRFAVENNKRIIFTSDMYLPKESLIKILKRNGYEKFENIYLSCEVGLTKRSGKLYEYVIEKENVSPSKILHIGDNYKYDIKMAQKFGIKTFYVQSNRDLFFNDKSNILGKRFKKLYKKNKNSLEMSIILALMSERNSACKGIFDNKERYFEDFGYIFGGIMGYAFCKFIIDNIAASDQILCIARDGYGIQKVINLLKPEQKTYYIYAQRIFKEKFGLNNNYVENLQQNIDEYKKYLQNEGIDLDKNIVLADTGASSFSAQRIIEKVLGIKTKGIYAVVDKIKNIKKYDITCKSWVTNKKDIKYITSLIEFIFIAPESPVVDLIDGKPVYINPVHEKELELNELAKVMSSSMLESVENIKNRFEGIEIAFDSAEIKKFVEYFICSLSKLDKQMLDGVYYASNVENTKYLPFLRKIYKLSKNPKYYWGRIIYNYKIKILKEYGT